MSFNLVLSGFSCFGLSVINLP